MYEAEGLPTIVENWSSPLDLARQLETSCQFPAVCDLTWRSGHTAAVVLVAVGDGGLIVESWNPATEEGCGDLHVIDANGLLRAKIP